MSNLIQWLPNEEADIDSYRIEFSLSSTTDFVLLVNIDHDLGDPLLFDDPYFFYDHVAGTNATYYRIISIDDAANESSPSAVFQPAIAPPSPFNETVALYHDYSVVNNLVPVDGDGNPVDECQVRVYTAVDFDNDDLTTPVGTTETDADGKWNETIFVSPGATYVIWFAKPTVFSPATVEVIT